MAQIPQKMDPRDGSTAESDKWRNPLKQVLRDARKRMEPDAARFRISSS